MRLPRTAKDDQPGPIGRRQSSTGGEAAQSVSIRTPRTTPSRPGPRKPGQFIAVFAPAEAAGSAAGWSRAGVKARGLGVSAAAGAEGSAAGWSLAWAIGRSLGVSAAGADARAA